MALSDRSAFPRARCPLALAALAGAAILFGLAGSACAQESTKLLPPVVASVEPSEIDGFDQYPDPVKKLLVAALALTRKNLGYLYGSAEPVGGMDCSGSIYYMLRQAGLKDVPRSSSEQYDWVKESGRLVSTDATSLDSPEFDRLAPGDLLFWSGTYSIQRANGITHAMIYLGKAKSDGLPLMVGSSDGRTYRGKKCYGVSVFDFRLPKPDSKSKFVGYGPVPGLASP